MHTFTIVHKSPHEKVPSVQCEQGDVAFRRPSGCIILHILSPQKRGVLVFHVVLWWSFLMKTQQEGTVPLSEGCFPELCRNCKYQLPLGVKYKSAKQDEWGNQLQLIQLKCSKGVFKKKKQANGAISVCGYSNVMIQETFCAFPNPSTSPQRTVSMPGSDTTFSGRKSLLIGLFTFVCNGRDPL